MKTLDAGEASERIMKMAQLIKNPVYVVTKTFPLHVDGHGVATLSENNPGNASFHIRARIVDVKYKDGDVIIFTEQF